jgi:mRNA interferase RelE/StbE
MDILLTESFKKDYKKLSSKTQRQVKKKLEILSQDPRHPSLRTKKIKGSNESIFECSINIGIRMTWQYSNQNILLRAIGEHDKTLNNP